MTEQAIYAGARGRADAMPHGRLDHAALIVLCGLTALVVATGWRLFHTYWGDPAIYLPYARNAAHGDFFSFNPHQFSSGTTSILWQLLLAIPFAVGAGLAGVKVFSIAATVLSVLTVAWAVQRFTSSWFAASLGTTFVAGSIALWGGLSYDSPLTVAAVALSMVAITGAAGSARLTRRSYLGLAAVWGVLLASRPDLIVIIGTELVALLVMTRSQGRRLLLIASAIVGAIPSFTYYGYSWLVLGSPSVASEARSFELAETASHWHGIGYSREALSYLNSISPTLIAATIASCSSCGGGQRGSSAPSDWP